MSTLVSGSFVGAVVQVHDEDENCTSQERYRSKRERSCSFLGIRRMCCVRLLIVISVDPTNA